MEYKLRKYIKKFYMSGNNNDTYLFKINKYINSPKHNGQKGGNTTPNPYLDYYVDSIINNNYRIQSVHDIVKNLNYEQCNFDFFGNPGEENENKYKPGSNFSCFLKPWDKN